MRSGFGLHSGPFPSASDVPAFRGRSCGTFAKNMNQHNDDQWWGDCPFTYEDINEATVECAVSDGGFSFSGTAKIRPRSRGDGKLRIDIEMPIENTGTRMTEAVIHVPPHAFQFLQKADTPNHFVFRYEHP